MGSAFSRFGFLPGLALWASLLIGCAHPIKTSVDWTSARTQPIPLAEAAVAWQQIQAGVMPEPKTLNLYNRAVRESVVQIARNYETSPEALSSIRSTDGPVQIEVESINVRNLGGISEVVPSDFVRVRRGFEEEIKVDGVGASLMIRRPWTEEDPMIPRTGLWYPVTGLLNLDDPGRPVLELVDPTRRNGFARIEAQFPLSVNYTSAFARDFQDRQLQFLNLPALLRFEKFADRMGLYRVTPFDPDKEVCVLVHGINSSPMTWHRTLNKAFAEREIRERYEFWTFGYPTGAPIPFLAAELRDSIAQMQRFRHSNGARNTDLTMVGHSLGGILTKAVTQKGDQKSWDQLFQVPIEQLPVSERDREILRRMVYYEPVADVKRVIFCATPHRGSQLAANPGLKLVGNLVQVPQQMAEVMTDIVQQSGYALTPLGLEVAKDRVTSLDQLRPGSRITADYLNRPLNPSVEFYSIIGNNKKDPVPPHKMTDGVVSYSSAHLEGVIRETIVHGSPHGVHREDEGIREIVRILKLP